MRPLDPTDDPTHGAQQYSLFNGYYDNWCYLPLLAFLTFDREPEQYLCSAVLRHGKAVASEGGVALLARLLPLLRCAFPRARFLVRLCPIAMLSMHASDQQIETVLANPAHRQWAERVEETVPTDVAEHVERIAEENDSAPLTDRNELRRYAAALLINDEPVSAPAAELVGLERETIRRLVDAADDTSTPLVLCHD